MATLNTNQAIQTLTKGRDALQQGNRLVLMKYGRWHYLTLSQDQDSILAVNFMSAESAINMVTQMLSQAVLIRFADISPFFEAELAKKVLPGAASYGDMLANGRCRLITGHTTDTLQGVADPIDKQIDAIQQLMDKGKRGP
jgi:hypothetical protein